MKKQPTYSAIVLAHERIKKYIHPTPVLTSSSINKMLGCELYFKCENFQKTGSFKFRGAVNSILSLKAEKPLTKVCAHSSGNHAAALSLAAKLFNVEATIVMFDTAPNFKINAVKRYGGKISFCKKPTMAQRIATLKEITENTQASEVHSSSYFHTICGQGTVAVELLNQLTLDMIVAPVGGGGLLSGTAIAAKSVAPKTRVVGAEPHNANDAFLSFNAGKHIPIATPKTICDGLVAPLSPYTFSIIQKMADTIFTAQEDSIKEAMKIIWERLKIVVEPSACVPLAIVLENPDFFKGKKVGLIVSGGNLDICKIL